MLGAPARPDYVGGALGVERRVSAAMGVEHCATLARFRITGSALLDEYCAALYERYGTIGEVARTTGCTRGTVRTRLRAARRFAGT